MAAIYGLTLKRANVNICGGPAYILATRGKHSEVVFGPATSENIHDNVCSGFVSTWDGSHFNATTESPLHKHSAARVAR
jgi:hypothetical protein